MNSTQTLNKPKRTSLVKNAVWSAILEATLVFINIIVFIKNQIIFTAEDYLAPVPLPLFISSASLILLIIIGLLSLTQTKNTEKEDELSSLNRYKAGYISKYICIIALTAAIWHIHDLSFAFTGDFVDNLRLPITIFMFSRFVENIIFIILEKCNLE